MRKLFNEPNRRNFPSGALWLPFIMALLWVAAPVNADAENLLRNPGFHAGSGQPVADHWHDNSGWADVAVSYDSEITANGQRVQKIACTDFQSGAVQFVQREIPIRKNHAYRITVRMRGNVETPVEIILRKRGRPYTIYTKKAYRISTRWKDYTYIGVSGHDDPRAVFHVRFADTGELFLSRAEVLDVTELEPDRPAPEGNRLPNGGFEVGLDRWGVNFRETGGYANALKLEYANPRPEIGEEGAAQGERFLSLKLPEECRVKVTSPHIHISPGKTCTVSCWMAASPARKVAFGVGSGYFGSGKAILETVSVSRAWKKYYFSFQSQPFPDSACFFFMQTSGKGAVFIDAVSLRHGNGSEYEPGALAEVGFLRDRMRPVVFQGSGGEMVVRAVNHGAAVAEAVVSSTDYWGREEQLYTTSIEPGGHLTQAIALPTGATGYRQIHARIKVNGTVTDVAETGVAIVPRPVDSEGTDSPFGGHVRFNAEMLETARMLGVKWLRTHPPDGTKWFIVEREKGTFSFFDAPFKLAREKGFHLLGMLATSPRWASSAPADKRSESVGGFRSYPAKDDRDWRAYVHQTVAHYKGTIDHWEVWNEPDTQFFRIPGKPGFGSGKPAAYSALLKSAWTTAKEANPEAIVIGGSAVKTPLSKWTGEILDAGAINHLDILSYHQYFGERPGSRLSKSIASEVADLRWLMTGQGAGEARPIWNTEGGILFTETKYRNIHEVTRDFALPADEGPVYLVRNYVRLLASGVEKLFFYHLFASHQSDRREGAGFFEWDGSPRPLAVAYAVLTNMLEGCTFSGYKADNSELTHAVFASEHKKVSVLWRNTKETGRSNPLAVEKTPAARVLDIMGNSCAEREENGVRVVYLTSYPVYLIESF